MWCDVMWWNTMQYNTIQYTHTHISDYLVLILYTGKVVWCPDFLHVNSWKESRSPCLCILSVGVDCNSCKSDRIILSWHSETFWSHSLSCHSIESQARHSPHWAINGPQVLACQVHLAVNLAPRNMHMVPIHGTGTEANSKILKMLGIWQHKSQTLPKITVSPIFKTSAASPWAWHNILAWKF